MRQSRKDRAKALGEDREELPKALGPSENTKYRRAKVSVSITMTSGNTKKRKCECVCISLEELERLRALDKGPAKKKRKSPAKAAAPKKRTTAKAIKSKAPKKKPATRTTKAIAKSPARIPKKKKARAAPRRTKKVTRKEIATVAPYRGEVIKRKEKPTKATRTRTPEKWAIPQIEAPKSVAVRKEPKEKKHLIRKALAYGRRSIQESRQSRKALPAPEEDRIKATPVIWAIPQIEEAPKKKPSRRIELPSRSSAYLLPAPKEKD